MDFKNYKCFICCKQFKDDDDIVVCPDCATPYHKECYKTVNKCVNEELHKSNKENEKKSEDTIKICPKCNAANKITSKFCENCGHSFAVQTDKPEEIGAIDDKELDEMEKELKEKIETLYNGEFPEIELETEDGVESKEIAKYVKKNIIYYMSVFNRRNKADKSMKLSFNLLCFFVPYYFFANRKMYLWAFISFVIMTLFSIPEIAQLTVSNTASLGTTMLDSSLFNAIFNTSAFLMVIFRIIIAFTANKLYYKHIISKIKEIKQTYPQQLWNQEIEKRGGTNFAAVLISVLIELATAIGLMFLITAFIIFFNLF